MGSILGQRLAKARKRAGLVQVELAVALGDRYSQSVISDVERGRSGLLVDGLTSAARELNVSADYLLGLTDDPTPMADRKSAIGENRAGYETADYEDDPKEHIEQLTEVAAAAGSGAEVYDETATGRVPFRSSWLRKHNIVPQHCNIIGVRGHSMEPTLPDGCSILVDRKRRDLRRKHIYVMRTEEGLVVKRVDLNKDGWWLISDNPTWLPTALTEGTDIIGEVRWSGRTF